MFSPQDEKQSPIRDPMLTDLPLIMASGTFKTLSSMPEGQIEKFLCYLVRFTCRKFNASPLNQPPWWTESVTYLAEFCMGQVPLPYTRNKSVKMRRLIRLCYVAHGCKDLLSLSEKLAALHALSYKFIRNTNGTVTVMQVSTGTPIVMIPSSNLDYDLDLPTSLSGLHEISIIRRSPLRTKLLVFDSKRVKTKDDEANNCILIEDSSSDDDVQIVSYEKGAFPPTPPKRKLPIGVRPGPACSKVLQRRDASLPVTNSVCSLTRAPQLVGSPFMPRPPGRGPSSLGTVPRPALHLISPLPKVAGPKKYLRFRRARPKQNRQEDTFLDIDLTIDDDEDYDPDKTACLPKELTQNSFLARFSLLGNGCKPPDVKCAPVLREKTSRMLNLKNLSVDQVPFMVSIGVLPNRCLCSQKELDWNTNFIEKYTRRDFECSRIVVNVRDQAAVARVTRKCSVHIKRLNSADLRKWRKQLQRGRKRYSS